MPEPITLSIATVTLLASAITASGEIISTYISSREDKTTIDPSSLINKDDFYKEMIKERELNSNFINKTIEGTINRFSGILDHISHEIIDETRKQRLRDAVQDVQAGVDSLRLLLNANSIDQNIFMQMVVMSIIPLQVALGKAKFVIQDYGTDEIWQFCHIIGTGALIAGYNFLGQDMPILRNDLGDSIRLTQTKILDSIARKIISSGDKFPWDKVSHLLSPVGIDELVHLYNSVSRIDPIPGVPRQIIDNIVSLNDSITIEGGEYRLAELDTSRLLSLINNANHVSILERLLRLERNGKNRKEVTDAANIKIANILGKPITLR